MVNPTGPGSSSSKRVYRRISPLARATTAPFARIAVLCRKLVSGHMCSGPCIPCSPLGLEHRNAEVVPLYVAIDE